MKKRHLVIIICAAALVIGCATVPLASADLDAAAKTFTPPEGKANIYVARGMGYVGGAASFQIVVDGRMLGNIAPGTFYVVTCDPGSRTVAAMCQWNTAKANVDVEAGKNYFFDAGWHMGLITGQAAVSQVGEDDGKKLVQQCKRAESLID